MNSLEITIKWLESTEINKITEDILINFGQQNIPIDIEYIVEVKYKLLIVPIEDLPQKAYLTKDLEHIIVNKKFYNDSRLYDQYRFILAHELGHYVLHKYVYEQVNYFSIEEYINFIKNFNEKQYGYFEWQANQFAGNILVPKNKLIDEYFKLYNNNPKLLQERKENPLMAYFDEKSELAKIFEVSDWVIDRRLKDNPIENFSF